MALSNLPPGVTDRMIEEHANGPAPVDTIAEEKLTILGLREELAELVEQDSTDGTDTEIARIRTEITRLESLPAFWSVAVYLRDRAYGGPEEGGWWYDCGERQDRPIEGLRPSLLAFITHIEGAAHRFAEIVQQKLDAGRYYAEVHRGYPPARYPERRPHYE